MIRRRQWLGAAAFGVVSGWSGAGLLAQNPRGKAKGQPKAGDDARPPLQADEQINRILEQARTDSRRLPGMIGAVVKGEEITAIGAVGIRKIGSPELIRINDVVHMGSNTKAMTATMIGTLVDEGKLRWETTIRDLFPDQAAGLHPEFQTVTLQHLLSHRAGLPHDVPWGDLGPGPSATEQRMAILNWMRQQTPTTRPGSAYGYSNVGYALAGLMAEQVSRTTWETLMRRRVFGPLGMASAGFGPPGNRGRVDHAWGHQASGDTVRAIHDDNPPSLGPAGTVHCSVPDWARFASFHLQGSFGEVRLLKPETLKALHTPAPGEDYAGGWSVGDRSWAGGRTLSHNGSNTYWYASIWLAPARDIAFLVATNAGGDPAATACDEALQGLIRFANVAPRPRRR